MRQKICNECKTEKNIDQFYKKNKGGGKFKYSNSCAYCLKAIRRLKYDNGLSLGRTKRCGACKEEKCFSLFAFDWSRTSGCYNKCKKCQNNGSKNQRASKKTARLSSNETKVCSACKVESHISNFHGKTKFVRRCQSCRDAGPQSRCNRCNVKFSDQFSTRVFCDTCNDIRLDHRKAMSYNAHYNRVVLGLQQTKECKRCGSEKDWTQFLVKMGSNNFDGLGVTCRGCLYKYQSKNSREDKQLARSRVCSSNRRALAHGIEEKLSADDVIRMWELYPDCLVCGEVGARGCDHVISMTDGGRNHFSNLQNLCQACNVKKSLHSIDYRTGERVFLRDPAGIFEIHRESE